MLEIEVTARFKRDYKRMAKKHCNMSLLDEVIKLIEQNNRQSKMKLKTRHKMHTLRGDWEGSNECHVANLGDWLLVWQVSKKRAVLLRTGTHDEIFR